MKLLILGMLCFSVLWAIACNGDAMEPPEATEPQEPTPDIRATLESGAVATQEANRSIEATITARVEATKAALPTATPDPTPTLLPTAIHQTPPTPRPQATATPMPPSGYEHGEIESLAVQLYNCLQENGEYREIYKSRAVSDAMLEGMSPEGADDLVDYMLSSREFFALSFAEAATEDPSTEDALLLELVACVVITTGGLEGSQSVDLLADELFDCLGKNKEFRELFTEGAVHGVVTEGVTEEDASNVVGYMLRSNELFVASIRLAVKDEGLSLAGLEATVAECEMGASAALPSDSDLQAYADRHAGGPGAIYVGDLGELAGPAPTREQGDYDGNVSLDSLQRHLWIYESPLYGELLARAKLTDPTPMTYDGETIYIQHACINGALLPCQLLDTFFVPNLRERTSGKVEFIASSFPELGLAGPDTLELVREGTLDSATVYVGYVGGEIPAIEIQNLPGIYASPEQEFSAAQAIIKDIEALVRSETGGVTMNHSWYAGSDQFLFCREKIDTLEDFEGKRTRSNSVALSDWLNGMGAEAQFLPFVDVYTAIERGILDCGVTGADAGYGQRWYEVAEYLMGPLPGFTSSNNVISATKWASLPWDLQRIIIEEAAKSELEALRLAAAQNDKGLIKLTSERGAGRDKMEFVPFAYEINLHSFNAAAMKQVIPAWVSRLGDRQHPIITETFNNKIGPMVGLRIERDGSVLRVPITTGPHAGQTMEQVLSE